MSWFALSYLRAYEVLGGEEFLVTAKVLIMILIFLQSSKNVLAA